MATKYPLCNYSGRIKELQTADTLPGGGLTIGDAITSGTANRILLEDGSNLLGQSANFTFVSDVLTVNGIEIARPTANSTVIGDVPVGITGASNSLIGSGAGAALLGGSNNFLFGNQAGESITTAQHNIAIGINALRENIISNFNYAIGSSTLEQLGAGGTAETNNTAFGYQAGRYIDTGVANVLIGSEAGRGLSLAAAVNMDNSVFIGNNVGATITDAVGNVSIGATSGASLSIGDYNVFLGYSAGNDVTEGAYNCYFGYQSGFYNATGDNNTAIGRLSMQGVVSNSHSGNTALGYRTLFAITTGANNTIAGSEAGDLISSGSRNLCLGYQSGDNLTTAEDCIIIGGVDADSATAHDQLNIGGLIKGDTATLKATLNGYLLDRLEFSETADSATTGTISEVLYTHSLVAGTLGQNEDEMALTYFGDTTATATNKLIWIEVDGTNIGSGGTWALNNQSWFIEATLLRVSATVVRCGMVYKDEAGNIDVTYTAVTTANLDSNAINIELWGRSPSGTGELIARGGSGKITQAV